METTKKVYKVKFGNITGRNGHFDMPKIEIMHGHTGISFINGIGKSGKVLNAGLSFHTEDFKRVMADQFTDNELFEILRDRNWALSVWNTTDVKWWAGASGMLITEEEAEEVIHRADTYHDASVGINFDILGYYICDVYKERSDEEVVGIRCNVQYHDEPDREFETFIHFDHGEPGDNIPYTDDQVFFYCNGPTTVISMMGDDVEGEFRVTEVHEMMYATS